MASITPGVVTPVAGAYGTNPAYSGTFIPSIWSGKLNEKFYATSTFADICNKNWEGEISNRGDKVIINNIPSLVISDYVVGGNLSYQTPTPNTIELVVDRAKYFGFNVVDVLAFQSQPNLMSMFSDDAAQQMRTTIDSTCLYRTLLSDATGSNEDGVVAANRGSGAGVKSGGYALGTDTSPLDLSSSADLTLDVILRLASVLDEQNIPDSGRWLLIDPATRLRLMGTKMAQAYLTGDDKSMLRNGMIGMIDRFKIYVTNQLPTKPVGSINGNTAGTTWVSGDGTEFSITGGAYTTDRMRMIVAGHTSAITFASQMTKTETLPNPTDFGKLVRGLNVFGHKVVKGTALARALVTK